MELGNVISFFQESKFLKFLVRITSVLLMIIYFYKIRIDFAYMPLTTRLVLRWSFISFICNIGLWFITTKWAKKWKFIAIVLYLPTLFLSPMIISGDILIISFMLAVLILINYFPWRK